MLDRQQLERFESQAAQAGLPLDKYMLTRQAVHYKDARTAKAWQDWKQGEQNG